MANNYCQYSAALQIPKGREEEAEKIAARVAEELEKEDYCGTDWAVEDKGTEQPYVWFSAEESGNPDHAESIAKAIVDEMKLDEPFVLSWANTCSKPRIDEFGGGAFVVRRGKDTVWVDATSEAMKQARMA
jgi:Fe-S oxidoreductase